MRALFIVLLCTSAFAQFRQLAGSSGSVTGYSSSAASKTSVLVGQPVVGEAAGGSFGTQGGMTAIFEETFIALDVFGRDNFIPTDFVFAQNFPNPFNPSTTFAFDLPAAAVTSLVVYDALGRLAARVLEQDLSAGRYVLSFQAPAEWSSGIYFARLTSGRYQQIRKLVLLK